MQNQQTTRFPYWYWWFPIVVMAIITPWVSKWDIALTNFVYAKGDGAFISNSFFDFMYSYGQIPALFVAVGAFVALIVSFFRTKYCFWRVPAAILVLVMLIGPGLVINGVLKEFWGRPRPRQVQEWGGTQSFHPYYMPNIASTEPAKSFPCGHASMGFYFFSVAVLGLRYQKRSLFWLGMVLAIALGAALGAARIFQGGHFLSDVLISALILWETSLGMNALLKRQRH